MAKEVQSNSESDVELNSEAKQPKSKTVNVNQLPSIRLKATSSTRRKLRSSHCGVPKVVKTTASPSTFKWYGGSPYGRPQRFVTEWERRPVAQFSLIDSTYSKQQIEETENAKQTAGTQKHPAPKQLNSFVFPTEEKRENNKSAGPISHRLTVVLEVNGREVPISVRVTFNSAEAAEAGISVKRVLLDDQQVFDEN